MKVVKDAPHMRMVDVILKEYAFGDIVKKEHISKVFDLEKPENFKEYDDYTFKYLAEIEALKDVMLHEHRIFLSNVRGKGYQLTEPKDQTSKAMAQAGREIAKSLNKAADILEHTQTEKLTPQELNENREARMRLSMLKEHTNENIKIVRADNKKLI